MPYYSLIRSTFEIVHFGVGRWFRLHFTRQRMACVFSVYGLGFGFDNRNAEFGVFCYLKNRRVLFDHSIMTVRVLPHSYYIAYVHLQIHSHRWYFIDCFPRKRVLLSLLLRFEKASFKIYFIFTAYSDSSSSFHSILLFSSFFFLVRFLNLFLFSLYALLLSSSNFILSHLTPSHSCVCMCVWWLSLQCSLA